jgi:hypothetical protein
MFRISSTAPAKSVLSPDLRLLSSFSMAKFFCALFFTLTAAQCFAQDGQVWTLTDAALRQRAVIITSLDADGAQVRDANSSAAVRLEGWDDLVMLSRGGPGGNSIGAGPFAAGLWSGDRFLGNPKSFSGESLLWDSSSLGTVKIGLGQLAYIIRPAQPVAVDNPREQDVVQLANGDSASGIVGSIDATSVSVQSTGDPAPVPLDSVRAILMSTPHRKSGTEKRGVRVTLADGSIVTAASIKLTSGTLALSMPDGQSLSAAFKDVTSIEQINGPISWLCQRVPSEDVQTPFWGGDPIWPTRVGLSVEGRPLAFGTRTYSHGIGVHAYSRLSYALDGTYAALRTGYSITGDSPLADLTVRIKLDGKAAYESSHVRSTSVTDGVVVDLHDARTLTLEVDYGPAGDVQGRLAWLDPVLMKTIPPGKAVNDPQEIPATKPADANVEDHSSTDIAAPATAPVPPPGVEAQPDDGLK